MTIKKTYTVFEALKLPDGARVNQRIPKKLLLENGVPTASDKRLITDAIEEIQWLAALKPNTVGVPDYQDTEREYLEIAVLAVALRGTIKQSALNRLSELIHRAIPYPVLLLVEGQALTLSLVHKRWAQNEAEKVVLESDLVSVSMPETGASPEAEASMSSEIELAFVRSLSIVQQPQSTLYALYQGWIECVHALQAARQTGAYQTAATPERAAARRQALAACERLEVEIGRLRAQGAKEKQMARQIEINLQLKALLAERQQIARDL